MQAAPALLRRMSSSEEIVAGAFTKVQADEQACEALRDDIDTLCTMVEEGGCSSLLVAEKQFGGE
jgi:hypothetical protein